mgnify:CR=1 FL=1
MPVVTPVLESSVHVVPLPDGGHREEWQVGGRYHRVDGPAVVVRNAAGVVVREEWWVEDRYHRTDGPARVEYNDTGVVVREHWQVEGRLHRDDGPAYVERSDAGVVTLEQWWVGDDLHRTDGPAVVEYNAAGVVTLEQWWVEGRGSTPDEVFALFLAGRGVAGLSPEALRFLMSTRPYEQWSFITDNEIALARLLHPVTEVG